ncbi:hypothetical protein CCHR01_10842 [Colletotrichum chrysophilum]|uniref:Uncharacterized protein n=1 Tax=Colletotrichum chrysophilum TaxID=1836956 RepID=A0AAD9AEX2_9PEZI|nr:hypothetical protein CCHR01_10842 [Colletotrichum chrysophilum]
MLQVDQGYTMERPKIDIKDDFCEVGAKVTLGLHLGFYSGGLRLGRAAHRGPPTAGSVSRRWRRAVVLCRTEYQSQKPMTESQCQMTSLDVGSASRNLNAVPLKHQRAARSGPDGAMAESACRPTDRASANWQSGTKKAGLWCQGWESKVGW